MSVLKGSPQQDFKSNFSTEGLAAPQPTGLARAMGFVRTIGGIGIIVAFLGYTLQIVLPEDYKPATLIGRFHGAIEVWHLNTMGDTNVEYQRRMTDAQAGQQAQWAMEVEVARQQQQIILESLQMLQIAANIADAACLSGPVARLFLGQDAAQYAQTVQGACGEAQKLRREMVAAQVEAARLGSAIKQRMMQAEALAARGR